AQLAVLGGERGERRAARTTEGHRAHARARERRARGCRVELALPARPAAEEIDPIERPFALARLSARRDDEIPGDRGRQREARAAAREAPEQLTARDVERRDRAIASRDAEDAPRAPQLDRARPGEDRAPAQLAVAKVDRGQPVGA